MLVAIMMAVAKSSNRATRLQMYGCGEEGSVESRVRWCLRSVIDDDGGSDGVADIQFYVFCVVYTKVHSTYSVVVQFADGFL